MLLAPLIAGIALRHRPAGDHVGRAATSRAAVHRRLRRDGRRREHRRRSPIVRIARIDDLRTVLLGMALFALGTRVDVGAAAQIGARRSRSGSLRGS